MNKREREYQLTFRVSKQEKKAFAEAAQANGVDLSNFLRLLLWREVRKLSRAAA